MSLHPLTAATSGPWHLDFSRGESTHRVSAGIAFVRRALTEAHLMAGPTAQDEDETFDVVLVAAELLGNGEHHGHGLSSVDVERHPGLLRLTVCDHNPAPPRPVLPHVPGRPGGHGLHIVDRLAAAWGWRAHGPGKAVWADLTEPAC